MDTQKSNSCSHCSVYHTFCTAFVGDRLLFGGLYTVFRLCIEKLSLVERVYTLCLVYISVHDMRCPFVERDYVCYSVDSFNHAVLSLVW